jgi:hypothetical protein
VKPGHLYAWYVLAVDQAGNREPSPANIAYTRASPPLHANTRRNTG